MKILIFTQHYPPDLGAQSFRIEALVEALIKREHHVSIITSRPHRYDIQENIKFKEYEKHTNLEVFRIKGGKKNDTFLRRPLNYLTFMFNSFLCSLKIKFNTLENNLILATSPPITAAVAALIVCMLKKEKFVLEVRDLWPDTLIELAIFKNKLIIRLLKYIEKTLYQRADLIISVTQDIKNKIIKKGISENKIKVFTNGLDKDFVLDNSIKEIKKEIRKKYNLPENSFIISYIGNIGISQRLEILIEAAKKYIDKNIVFLFVGDGLEKKKILKLSKDNHVEKNVIFIPPLPREKVKEIYELTDILFLQLRKLPVFEGAIPSKIFEYLGSGKPIIYG